MPNLKNNPDNDQVKDYDKAIERSIHRLTRAFSYRGLLSNEKIKNALKISDSSECFQELMKIAKKLRLNVDEIYQTDK